MRNSLQSHIEALLDNTHCLHVCRRILWDECEIEYGEIEDGNNPDSCFIIPGSLSTALTWENTAIRFMQCMNGYYFGRLVCVTPFGMGNSKMNNRHHFNVDSIANAYSELIDAIISPAGKITIIAHSKADLEALMLCKHLKGKIKGLVLASPVMLSEKNITQALRVLIDNYGKDKDTQLMDRLISVREALRATLGGIIFQIKEFNETRNMDLQKYTAEIDFPVLVIGGDHDIESVEYYHKCANLFSRGSVCIVEGTTHHFPHYNPDVFTKIVKDWMDSL